MTGAEAFRRPPDAPPRIYGHRGARAHAPENTLAAGERAWTDGADGIELDVRVTADGEVLVLHDPSFARVTGGRDGRAAAELRWDEARRIDVGAGEHAPSLAEVLRFALEKRLLVNVELKHDVPDRRRVVREAARVLRDFAGAAVLVSSFDPRMLAFLALVGRGIPRALLVSPERKYRPIEGLAGPLATLPGDARARLLRVARAYHGSVTPFDALRFATLRLLLRSLQASAAAPSAAADGAPSSDDAASMPDRAPTHSESHAGPAALLCAVMAQCGSRDTEVADAYLAGLDGLLPPRNRPRLPTTPLAASAVDQPLQRVSPAPGATISPPATPPSEQPGSPVATPTPPPPAATVRPYPWPIPTPPTLPPYPDAALEPYPASE